MDRLTISVTKDDPLLEIDVKGDLSIKGSDELEISVKTGSPDETVLEETEETFRLSCPDDCKVLVPRQARLRITNLQGDGVIKAIEGDIEIEKVNGDLTLRSVGSIHLDQIIGRLEGKNIMGDLEAGQVKGNLVVRDVQGDFIVKEVSGNLVLDDVDGNVNATASENATLRLDPAPGAEYVLKASGNLTCSLPDDASAEVEIRKADRILVNFPGLPKDAPAAPYTVTLAEGDAKIVFEAAGNVTLNSQAPDWQIPEFKFGEEFGVSVENLTEQINRQIEVQMANLDQQLNMQLANLNLTLGSSGMSPEKIERLQDRARRATEQFSERAQEKLERAQERLERKLTQAQRHAERQARIAEARARAAAERARHREHATHRAWGKPVEPVEEPVQEEERLLILKMLQEKKISMEEAESLLSALEGK